MKRLQVGMLVPWVNTAMEEEIPSLVHPSIGLHWSRLRPRILPRDGHDDSYLEHMLLNIPDALSCFDGLDLDIIVLGCTSASFSTCSPGIEVPDAYKGSRFIGAFDSIILELKKIQAKTLLLFAPYDRLAIDAEAAALEARGLTVVRRVPISYSDQIRYITPEQVCDIFSKEYSPECDAIVFSCTALYTLEAIGMIKRGFRIEVPLLSSNTAISSTLNDLYHHCSKITN